MIFELQRVYDFMVHQKTALAAIKTPVAIHNGFLRKSFYCFMPIQTIGIVHTRSTVGGFGCTFVAKPKALKHNGLNARNGLFQGFHLCLQGFHKCCQVFGFFHINAKKCTFCKYREIHLQ